jgi:hypothetical protein
LEDLFRCLQRHACLRSYRLEDSLYAWRAEPPTLELLANTQASETP